VPRHLNLSRVLVLPSFGEGFGLPPIEAAAPFAWEKSARQLPAVFEEVRRSHHAETA
jgi:hypothetical protein